MTLPRNIIDGVCKEYLENNLTIASIAKRYNIHPTTVTKIRKRNNISDREIYDISVNENYFDKIDSKNKAYWLGFIAGDGHVSELHKNIAIELGIRDKNHLQLFLNSLESDHVIKIRNCHNKKTDARYQTCHVSICRSKIVADLTKHGVGPNKSKELSISPTIPENLVNHFVRGIIDSDGCWSLNINKYLVFSIVASDINFISEIQKLLIGKCNLNVTKIIPNPTKKAFTIRYEGNVQTKRIFDYLYEDGGIRLDRKFQIANSIFNKDYSIKSEKIDMFSPSDLINFQQLWDNGLLKND